MLRDLARKISFGNQNVLIVDERNEICSYSDGKPYFKTGGNCDVITYGSKEFAFSFGIRTMSPSVIITDELMTELDSEAVMLAAAGGVKVIASVHAEDVNELKSKGYLFIHVYPGEKGRFVYQYELRPDNSGWDGAYLFYHDRNGHVKSTNLTRNQTETAEQPAEKASADHHPNYHPGGNHPSENHCGGNRGGNIKLNHKEKLINMNLSISPAAEPPESGGEMDENVLENIVLPALAEHKCVPQAYMAKPALMQTAIHYLTGYDFRQQHPYQTNGVTDDARQSAFGLLNTCLTEMCCATGTQSYRGALVTADKVLAEISCASNGCEEDGLEPYVEDVLDTFLQAITTRKVKNLPQYMKSLLWTSFATYKLNTISGITAPYKEVKNVYGLH